MNIFSLALLGLYRCLRAIGVLSAGLLELEWYIANGWLQHWNNHRSAIQQHGLGISLNRFLERLKYRYINEIIEWEPSGAVLDWLPWGPLGPKEQNCQHAGKQRENASIENATYLADEGPVPFRSVLTRFCALWLCSFRLCWSLCLRDWPSYRDNRRKER